MTAATALAVCGLALGAMARSGQATARPLAAAEPVVVELFTAQGCGACPEANRMVEALAAEPGVIALTYGVDYWDYLGWSDTFARPEFAERQRDYQTALRLRDVYTPQIVIDGERQVSGADGAQVRRGVDEAAEDIDRIPEVEVRASGDQVDVGAGQAPEGGADVVAVVYRPGQVSVAVRQGDNRGQTVRQTNVVREIRRLGDWTGRARVYAMPVDLRPNEAVAVLIQARNDRRILAADTL